MIMGTVEYRFPIVNKVQGALFVDAGDAWGGTSYGPWDEIEDDLTIHTSVGVGMQLQTPIGALRLDYGWGEDGGRLHFTVGGAF